jgi:arabinoxylan arabinofuranohydrolase
MRTSPSRLLFALGSAFALPLLASSRAGADYPIMSHRYLADPGSLVYEGRLYLYNSNDDDNPAEGDYSMHSIVCVSTSDLKNWTDHGIVFQVPEDASWANDSWAPSALERDGKIYLYFGNSGSGVGVATSDSPIGKFEDARGSYLVNSSTPGAAGTNSWLFDPGAFIDDDGQAYLAFGGNGVSNARIIRLGSDLVSVTGSATGLSPQGFYEAAFLFKRNGLYYFAYSTNPDNGLRIDYLTSDDPMSGFTYRGVLADQPPENGNNNHASEFEFDGQWYHAFHNRSVSTAAGIPTTLKRNLALEVLNFEADGTVREVTYTTDGVPQRGRLDPYTRVEAETMNAQSGIETEPCNEGGMNLTDLDAGDWVRVRGVDFGTAGAKTFSARVASTGSGAIELRLGSATGMLAGTCSVAATGGAQTWASTTCDVSGATGVQDLVFKFTGSSFNFDWWQFTGGDGAGGSGGMGAGGAAPGSGGSAGLPAGGNAPGGGGTDAGRAGSSAGGAAPVSTGGAAPVTGGSSTTGGAPSGGRSGTGGVPASSGASAGGAAGRSGGSAGGPVPSDGAPTSSSSDGCACGVPGGARGNASFGAAVAAAVVLWGRARRRARRVRTG